MKSTFKVAIRKHSVVAKMLWTTGLFLVLAVSQVPAELVQPEFIENVIAASPSSSRILSGWAAQPGQIPYQVALRLVNGVGAVQGCGGSVVSKDWLVSAAHCTAGMVTVVVRAGLTNLPYPEYFLETQEWYNHPSYNDWSPAVQPNDISLIKLQTPVKYSPNLRPIRIQPWSDAFRNYDLERVQASGFGRTWTDGASPENLNFVYLTAVSNLACSLTFGSQLINDNAICARFYNVTSQSTCQGDSGGPLVHQDKDGVTVLVGVASFVAGGNFGCHSGLPAGFIRPGPFLPWFEQVTGIDFENLNEEEEVTTIQPETEPPQTTAAPQTTTAAPLTTTAAPLTTTAAPLTTTVSPLTTTAAPLTTTAAPLTTTAAPLTTTAAPQTTTSAPQTTAPPQPTDAPETTTVLPPTTEGESEEDSAEVTDLLQNISVQVKVKVKINNELKAKVKVKCNL